MYAYVGGEPVNFVDPTGAESKLYNQTIGTFFNGSKAILSYCADKIEQGGRKLLRLALSISVGRITSGVTPTGASGVVSASDVVKGAPVVGTALVGTGPTLDLANRA